MTVNSTTDIALFVPSLRGGGAEQVMLQLAEGFSHAGLKVDMVLGAKVGPLCSRVPDYVQIVDLGKKRIMVCLPGLVRYLRKHRPNCLLATQAHACILAVWAGALSGTKTKVFVREANTSSVSSKSGMNWRDRLLPVAQRMFYPKASGVVAISRGVADDLAGELKIPENRITIIHNPVDTRQAREKAKELPDHPWFREQLGESIILGAGRLEPQKDFATLIKAVALVRKTSAVRLMILGEGSLRNELEVLARECGFTDDFAMPGFTDNPFAFMSRASVFVLSSAWEGFSNVLVEAMAVGTPVVATNCPSGPDEILDNGIYGPLVESGDVEGLAEAIRTTLDAPIGRDVLIDRAATFNAPGAIHKYLQLLQGCTAGHHTRERQTPEDGRG